MTKLLSLLRRGVFGSCPSAPRVSGSRLRRYHSVDRLESAVLPGVAVTIRRMSLGRRIELARAVRDLAGRLEFLQAGSTIADRIDAAQVAAEIDATYLRWGVAAIDGLELDGLRANCEDVIAGAPEEFIRELVSRVKHECGLTGDERKN